MVYTGDAALWQGGLAQIRPDAIYALHDARTTTARQLEHLAHPRHVSTGGAEDMAEQHLQRRVRRIGCRGEPDRRGVCLIPDIEETTEVLIM